ncbi:MAG: hypothetical protein GX241_04480 [Ruminococcaceae bacterium]|nr:hypothetical protein [Oscillospiraceae bacterium]
MKAKLKNLKPIEIIIFLLQFGTFYLVPAIIGIITDFGDLLALYIIITTIIGFLFGSISKGRIRPIFSVLVGLLFIPSYLIFFKEVLGFEFIPIFTAFSFIGVVIGTVFGIIIESLIQKIKGIEKKEK